MYFGTKLSLSLRVSELLFHPARAVFEVLFLPDRRTCLYLFENVFAAAESLLSVSCADYDNEDVIADVEDADSVNNLDTQQIEFLFLIIETQILLIL